jgi:hypothetical protein
VAIAEDVRPWRLCWHPRGRHQLEVAARSAVRRGFSRGQSVDLRTRGAGDRGHARAQSPRLDVSTGGEAYLSVESRCGGVAGVPSVPPPAGSAGAVEHHSGRRSPCARIC